MVILQEYFLFDFATTLLFFLAVALAIGNGQKKPEKNEKRLQFFDFARGIAAISVVGLHAAGAVSGFSFLGDILRYSVPVFLITSGFLLAHRYGKKLDLGRYSKSFFLRIIAPYFAYVIIWTYFFSGNFSDVLKNAAFGLPNGGSLYFIPVIIQLYLLFPVLNLANGRKWLMLALVAGALLYSEAMHQWDDQLQGGVWGANPASQAFFGRYAFYFIFGMWLSKYDFENKAVKNLPAILAIGAICVAVLPKLNGNLTALFGYPLLAFFAFNLLFHLARAASEKITSLISEIGQNAFAIYLLHAEFLYPLAGIFLGVGINGVLLYLMIVLCATSASYATAKVFEKAWFFIKGKIPLLA